MAITILIHTITNAQTISILGQLLVVIFVNVLAILAGKSKNPTAFQFTAGATL